MSAPTVCIVGSGAREHALALTLGRFANVVVTPGNPALTSLTLAAHSVVSEPKDPADIECDLYVIGPEAPLVAGLADELRASGHLVFGPGADGARLEGSKTVMKELCAEAGVPTASWGSFEELWPALRFLESLPGPYVIKTDGLAAGKGVLVTADLDEAAADLKAKLSGESFGPAGKRVVIEEAMTGPELSLFAVCDGKRAVPLGLARDFKRLLDGDKGPNTGGMGAVSPPPGADDALVDDVMERIVLPTLQALRRSAVDYRGLLYAGLMRTGDGPKLLEFNVRFGDPETEVVLPRATGDLFRLLRCAAEGDLLPAAGEARFSDRACVGVVLAAPGYPDSPVTGRPICGLEEADTLTDVTVFHAGTRIDEHGTLVTAGGRVLCVSALGESVAEARARAYQAVDRINFPNLVVRRDIAAADGAA